MMTRRIVIVATTCLFLLPVTVATVRADNVLEVAFDKYFSGAEYRYDIPIFFDKDGAATCRLENPYGDYTCIPFSAGFTPISPYWAGHSNLTFAQLTARIAGVWTIYWDEGLPTETVAVIDFGAVEDTEFPRLPVLVVPPDGAFNVHPDVTIDWDYGGIDPCTVQIDIVEAFVTMTPPEYTSSGELACDVTAWTPPEPLAEGQWRAEVHNAVSIRNTVDGIGGPIVGDPWELENEDWLDLQSIVWAHFTVSSVAAEALTFGDVKSLYR